ncbi:probable DNA repair protein [Pseudomonas aeruginosa]|uniref:hypothetical protein n=1 Tax=Pseudomonas aeruginosa TaxID=287 RepID=UPI000E013025|nr:hypothetical protein [Pseudomonas aeruginosa]SUC99315.1 probable DNA repair protein [Pseudomonas aeruginosa]
MKFLKELSDLNEGTLVLTSTERVARHLRLQSALLQSMSGKKAWFNKGRIQTVTSWIENAWLELMPAEQLLYPVQELAVVKGLADSSGLMPATLISSTATSRRIGSAYSEALKYQSRWIKNGSGSSASWKSSGNCKKCFVGSVPLRALSSELSSQACC